MGRTPPSNFSGSNPPPPFSGLVDGLIKNRLAPKLGSVNFNHLEHLSIFTTSQIVDTFVEKWFRFALLKLSCFEISDFAKMKFQDQSSEVKMSF